MVLDGLLALGGLLLLVAGGELLVRGASGVALLARIAPVVVGLTIVSAGTSMPELVVSVQAALKGYTGLALGNVVGSNIFNIGAILGVAALVRPLKILGNTVRLEWPVMMLAAFQLLLLARDGLLDRLEGAFLTSGLVAFTAYAAWVGRKAATAVEEQEFASLATASLGRTGRPALWLNLGAIGLGILSLAGGSTALVNGAASIAGRLGVSQTVIGLTVVAAGTSTPELVTSLVASWRGQDDIAVANVIGSCIFNVLGIAGLTALLHPIPAPEEILRRDLWWMVGASALLFPLMRTRMQVTRLEGTVLCVGFLGYMASVVAAL